MKILNDFSKINRWIGILAPILLTIGLGVYDYAVIQTAEKKVEQIAEKKMPLFLAEKGLAAAGDSAEEALQRFLESNGDELYKKQLQQQAAVMEYHMDAVKKLTTPEELNTILAKNSEWLAFTEKEILNAAEEGAEGEGFAQNLSAAHAQINDIQTGYQEQIAAQKHAIQELEQEVMTAEKTSHLLIGMMSLILAATCISFGIILFRKIVTPKEIKVSNVA